MEDDPGDFDAQLDRDGTILRIPARGRARLDDFVSLMGDSRAIEEAGSTTGTLLDFRAVEHLEVGDDDAFGIVIALRSRFHRGADYRYAVLAPPSVLSRMAGEFVAVRELVVDGDTDVPEVRGFADADDAIVWLRREDGG